jgi:DNA repair exonuclease SbcCD ATPase subunit
MSIEELKAKAQELGVEFDDDTTYDDLQKAIEEKEKETKKDPEDDPEYYKSELKKVIAQRDREKSEKRKLQNKLSELDTKMKEFPDAEDYEKTKQAYNELLEFKKEIEQQKEEEELKNKTELERAEVLHKKQLKEIEEKFNQQLEKFQKQIEEKDSVLQEKDKKLQSNRKLSLEKDILEFAAKYEAYNPQQIVRLLSPDFTYDDQLEKWVMLRKDNKGKIIDELETHDYVKEFLTNEDNSNLVRAKINSDGSSHQQNISPKKPASTSKKYDPNDDTIKSDAEMRGLSVEDYIDVLEKRDAKLEKVEASKNRG